MRNLAVAVTLASLLGILLGRRVVRSGTDARSKAQRGPRSQVPNETPARCDQSVADSPTLALERGKVRRRGRGRAIVVPTSSLVLTMIIALGLMGVVQGMWSKNLTVSGEVEVGDLNADWGKVQTHDKCNQKITSEIATQANGLLSQTNNRDSELTYGDMDGGGGEVCPHHPCPGGQPHVVTDDDRDDYDRCAKAPVCEVTIGGVDGDGQFANQVAYVDIKNATPGYWCEIRGWVENAGTVPFNVIGMHGILDAKNEDGLSFHDLTANRRGDCKLIDEEGHRRANRQVDPGEAAIVVCKIVIDKSDKVCEEWKHGSCKSWEYTGGAKLGWTYHFAVEVCVAQWNEDPSNGGAVADFAACKQPAGGTHEGPDTPELPTPAPRAPGPHAHESTLTTPNPETP